MYAVMQGIFYTILKSLLKKTQIEDFNEGYLSKYYVSIFYTFSIFYTIALMYDIYKKTLTKY